MSAKCQKRTLIDETAVKLIASMHGLATYFLQGGSSLLSEGSDG